MSRSSAPLGGEAVGRSASATDPLSDVLSLLRLQSYGCGGFDVGGELSLQFHAHDGIKCYAVVSGLGWLAVEGVPEPVRLQAGDCFVLPRGRPFRLATNLDVPSVDGVALLMQAAGGPSPAAGGVGRGRIGSLNGGGSCCIVGGHFALKGSHEHVLLGVLPPIVHLQKESDKATLRWAIERMMDELRDPRPGGMLIAEHLAHMMLVQALRLHLAEGVKGGVGWLFALADDAMGAAIHAMHEAPGHPWTLQTLADRVGMSRSTFAQRFKDTVGTAPMEYLTNWRMLIAGDRLINSNQPVSVISESLGYQSEAAFSTAFKRVMGCSPRHYKQSAGFVGV